MFGSFKNWFLLFGSISILALSAALPLPALESQQIEKSVRPHAIDRLALTIPSSIVTTNAVLPSILAETEQPVEAVPEAPKSKEIEPQPKEENVVAQKPIIGAANRISVPSIKIDIDVRPGTYDTYTNSWIVDDNSAFHADTTVPINDTNGTTLIYGHAKWGIFGNLPDIQEGAEATVYSADGSRFVYMFESVREVDPDDVSMLTSEGPSKLILQTCSGLFDQHRTLATFRFKQVV